MRDPVAPEVDQQADGAADVEHDHEGQPRRLGLGLPDDDVVPAKQGREQHRVAQAGDREQLGGALQDAEDDRLEGADQVVRRLRRWSSGRATADRLAVEITGRPLGAFAERILTCQRCAQRSQPLSPQSHWAVWAANSSAWARTWRRARGPVGERHRPLLQLDREVVDRCRARRGSEPFWASVARLSDRSRAVISAVLEIGLALPHRSGSCRRR